MKRKHFITILPSGYGYWKITSNFRGKTRWNITSDSRLIDRYNELKNERNRGILTVEAQLHRIAIGNA